MDQYRRNEWYDQSLPAAAAPKAKAKHPGLKAALLTSCVLVLILSSVYIVRGDLNFLGSKSGSANSAPYSSWPSPVLPSSAPRDGDDDDFRSFFDEYYQPQEETYTGSHLEKRAGDPGVTLTIVSAEGRQEKSFQDLYRDGIDSIVGIEAYKDGCVGYAWGTGVILTADGYVVTNEHVIDEADRASVVLFDGRKLEALLIGEDTQTDIAILKIEAGGLRPAEFGDSAALSVGDRVVAIGNPLGDNLTGTMTDGIVSAINRDIQMSGHRMTLIQTNAALNEGNSGGPLFNVYGQVVGITNMKMVNRYSDVTVEGIGFAIPSATVKAVADQLIAKGEVTGRPGLGITVGVIPESAKQRFDFLPEGLYIFAVSEGSDAKEKGVRPGDILTHVNGQEVRLTTDVLAIRDACAVGDILTLTLWRDGETLEIDIVLRDLNNLY